MRGGMATESPPRYKGKPDLAIAGQPSRWPRRLGVSLGINGGGLGSGCEAAWGARRVGRAIEITVHPVVEGLPVPCDLDTSIKGALRAGHLKRAKRMPNIRSGCGNRDRWEENEVLIPVKKIDSQRPLLDALGELSRRCCVNKKENAERVANYLQTMGIIWRMLSRPKAMIIGQIAYLDANGVTPLP